MISELFFFVKVYGNTTDSTIPSITAIARTYHLLIPIFRTTTNGLNRYFTRNFQQAFSKSNKSNSFS